MVEKWNNAYEKVDDGLISNTDRFHPCKNRSQSAKPGIPTFQYSGNPRLLILAEPFDSDPRKTGSSTGPEDQDFDNRLKKRFLRSLLVA
jgi:hypothetical protein